MIEFLTITLIICLAAISPGPDFAMVVKNALMHDRKSGIFTALGVSCSLLIHASYCILGLAIIISKSLLLFSIIKYMGAAYLIYIGIVNLLAKRPAPHPVDEQIGCNRVSVFRIFSQGLLCNLLNPKAILFILAFFTLIIKPSTSWLAQMGFAIEIALIHFVWFSLLAVMITHKHVKASLNKLQYYIVKLIGGVLIGFGTHIAISV